MTGATQRRPSLTGVVELHLEPLSPFLGVEARSLDLKAALADDDRAVFGALNAAIDRHRLVRIRDLDLSPQDFVAVAAMFGPVSALRRASKEGLHFPDFPAIKVVANGQSADGVKLGDGDAAENAWHTDGTYLANPTCLTFLYGRKIPSQPPRTVFMDMTEVYRRLPERLKAEVAGRSAVHYSLYNHDEEDEAAIAALQDPADRKRIGPSRPLVVRHPVSGLPSLAPPRQRDCVIDGLDDRQSRVLADALWDFIAAQDCVWGEVITPGDLLLWDNRFSLHMREAFANNEERLLWHTTTGGARYELFTDNPN